MNTKVIALTVIVAILTAAIMVGCIERGTPISNSDFKNISADALDDLAYQLVNIKVAADSGEFVTAKMELAAFDTSLEQYIEDFEEMRVAENTLPCKKALISGFEETRIVGIYFGAYLENPTVDEYVRYNMQAINATNQMDIAAMLAKSL